MLRVFVFIFTLILTTQVFANKHVVGQSASVSEAAIVLKSVKSDVMIKAALAKAVGLGAGCMSTVLTSVYDVGGGIRFEVQIDCSVEGTKEIAGGSIMLVNVRGLAFGNFLDHLRISVDKTN